MDKFSRFIAVVLVIISATVSARESNRWPLVFNDDFNELNERRWGYETVDKVGGGWGNGEIQTYTTRNAQVRQGVLHVELRKENGGWTSSRLTTEGKFSFTYGRVDARVRTARRNGVWPAVWALSSKGRWPSSGEIDLFEMQTRWNYIPSSLHFSAHHAGNALSYKNFDTHTARWRIYSMEWTPTYIAFFHDEREIGRYNKPAGATTHNWPFTSDNRFHLIINNAMQPFWGTHPDGDMNSHTLDVDYIKVWKYPGRV